MESVEQPMAWSRVFNFDDPFPFQQSIRGSDNKLLLTRKGDFRAELTQVTFNRLMMQRFDVTLPQVYTSQITSGRRVIAFLTGEQPTFLHRGRDLSLNEIVVCNYDVVHHRTEGDCRFGAMSLAPGDFDAACRAIAGDEFSGVELEYLVRPSSVLMRQLQQQHELIGKIAIATPNLLELPEVARALEHNITYTMIKCLTEGLTSKVEGANHRHGRIVARFEEFLEANPVQPLYLADICTAIGVAERTLRVACEEHLGMGPIRYLTLRRLHLVRRALLRADPSCSTVTKIATDHGFWELGRFAAAYRTMFGEPPSITLRRFADDNYVFDRPTSPATVSFSD
ncbi:helix-turn-helix domain-containing protein [Bradyrhizobium sp. RT6a]|uniref:helix-turn-helix domain-containing protein n=1 Tax=unclassified Bradyrhizobium TaxID=2631580 RepID=UPI0033986554